MKVVGRLKAILGLDDSQYKKGLDKSKAKASKTMQGIKKQALKIGSALAGVFAIKGIAGAINKTASYADELGKLSKQTGFTVEQIQKYRFAAERSGISSEKMSMALQVFQKRLGELKSGTGSLHTRLKKMDPAFMQQIKNAESAQQAFRMYADRMKNASNETEQAALAQAGFSRSGLDMTRLLREGSAGLDRYGKIAEETGGILSSDLVKAAEEYKDQQTDMNMAFMGLKGLLTKALLPIIKKWMGRIQSAAKFVKDNIDTVKKWAKVIGTAVGALGAARVAMIAFNTVLKANPIGLIITALVTLVSTLAAAWKESDVFRAKVKFATAKAGEFFKSLWIRIKFGAKGMWENIKARFDAIGNAAGVMWKAIKAIFQKGKSPGQIIKEGFSGIRKDLGDAGKGARQEMEKELAKIKTPDYKKILNKEKAKSEASKAGEETGRSFAQGVKRGVQMGQQEGGDGGANQQGITQKKEGKGGSPLGLSTAVDTELASVKESLQKNNKFYQNHLKEMNKAAERAARKREEIFRKTTGKIQNMLGKLSSFYNNMKQKEINIAEQKAKEEEKSEAWLANKKEKINAKYAKKQKAIKYGEAVIAMAQGIVSAFSPYIPGVSEAMAAVVAAAGSAQLAVISSQSVGMQTGGVVPPGYPGDSYPAMLTSGEAVIPPGKLPDMGGGRLYTEISGENLRIILDRNSEINERV